MERRSLSPTAHADALLRHAMDLPAEEREKFLADQVEDDSTQQAIARRLEELVRTQTRGPGSATDADVTISFDGSTKNISPDSADSDLLTLPTVPGQPATSDNAAGPIGQIGEYELLHEVARGGMGVVFKARHRVLDRLVAIKIPRAAQLEDEGEVRFLREARAAAQLRHPHICPIYEVGHVGRQPFIALGFIEGPTLRQKLCKAVKAREAAEIIAKIARAVHYAHEHGVIHRDIKPSNIMLEADSGEPVLMDFGLAKQLSEGDSHVTKSGQVMGTPVYMAPEQAAGRHDKIGAPSDVYACGAVLYELLTGRPPFQGSTGEVIRQVQTDEPAAPRKLSPTIHRDLETICLKAMAKDPAGRYASAQALAEDLERFAAGEAILAQREGLSRRALRFLRRHHRAAAAILIVAVLTCGIASYFAISAREARQVAGINRQFHEKLHATNLTEEDWQQLESLSKELEAFDPAASDSIRRQLYQKVDEGIRDRIAASGVLEETDFQQLEHNITWLSKRDAAAADAIGERLQSRRRTWQEVFAMQSPFENRNDIFSSELVTIAAEGLLHRPPEPQDGIQVLSQVPSSGSVRLRAHFGPEFSGASEIGLMLHAGQRNGYVFRLRAPQSSPRITRTIAADNVKFWHHMEVGGAVDLEILRDGSLLRQTRVNLNHAMDAGTKELTLQATVDGDRLSIQVGREPALVFEDIFPYVGGNEARFGLLWPPNVRLLSLTAQRKPLPVEPSPLEQGDQLFAEQQWDAALTQYRQQANLASDERLLQQARFKQALCQIRLNDNAEAAQLLESLTNSTDDRLRLLAGCQLWLLHLRTTDYSDAAVVFESLKSQFNFQQLALLVPEADRQDIIRRTYDATTGLNLYRFGEDDLRILEHADGIRGFLDPNPSRNEHGVRTWQFLRGLHISGEIDRGIQLVQRYRAQGIHLDESMAVSIVSEGAWLLRQRGEVSQAREMIDSHIGNPQTANRWQVQLLVERARIMAAQQDYDQAAIDLDTFLASEHCRANYREFSAACLMRGLLHQRNGEMARARVIWQRGLHQNWLSEVGETRPVGPSLTGSQAAQALLLCALCGDRPQKEVSQLMADSFPISNSGTTAQLAKQYAHVLVPAVNNMAASDRGQDVIWRSAFLEPTLKQLIREPANLILLEMTRLGAAPGDWTAPEEQIVWDMVDAGFDLYSSEQIGMAQAVQIMLTWKGANNIFGWKGVAPSLDAKVRAPMAYVFGYRYLKLGKPADAREFFQTAINDAEEGSPLKKLAEIKLAETPFGD